MSQDTRPATDDGLTIEVAINYFAATFPHTKKIGEFVLARLVAAEAEIDEWKKYASCNCGGCITEPGRQHTNGPCALRRMVRDLERENAGLREALQDLCAVAGIACGDDPADCPDYLQDEIRKARRLLEAKP
jgi:hypothetical protein